MTCLHCHDTGIISRPYIVGLRDGDLYTHTICTCPAGQRQAQAIADDARKDDHE